MRTSTLTLADAVGILSRDIYSGDGVANAALAEAAERLREQHAALRRLTYLYESENEPCDRPAWLREVLD